MPNLFLAIFMPNDKKIQNTEKTHKKTCNCIKNHSQGYHCLAQWRKTPGWWSREV